MATSRKEPSRERASTGMSPNPLRPSSSSESSSSGYGARRARSVPSSPDRKFGAASPSTPAPAPSASTGANRPSLSQAGRSVSSRTMSSSGSSSAQGASKGQPFPKPTLARAKSDKISVAAARASPRPPSLAVPATNSFKDMARAATPPSKGNPRSKLSPKPAGLVPASSPKPTTLRSPASASASASAGVRGGRAQPLSSARSPATAPKKRSEAANGGAAASSKARSGAPQKAMEASATSKEKEEEPSMQFEESESINTASIDEHLHEQLPDPVDPKSSDMAASGSAHPDQQEPHPVHPEIEGCVSAEKEDAGGNELHNGGEGADDRAKNIPSITNAADSSEQAEKEGAKAKADKFWRKDEPKSNDVIEETKSKLLEERKSRVKALVGAFETVMSFKE